jgi:hypothetical protein
MGSDISIITSDEKDFEVTCLLKKSDIFFVPNEDGAYFYLSKNQCKEFIQKLIKSYFKVE